MQEDTKIVTSCRSNRCRRLEEGQKGQKEKGRAGGGRMRKDGERWTGGGKRRIAIIREQGWFQGEGLDGYTASTSDEKL